MIRKQIVSSNEIDRQNQRISLCALQEMASRFSQSEAVARMGIAHDITLLPVGKVLQGELVDLGHGIIGLEVQIDDFMEEFQQIHGPDNESLYYGRSLQDSRPFVEICSDLGGEFTVSLNPIDFTDADFEEIVRFVSESENGQIETLAKKAFEPEIEIVITLATKILQYLIVKKLLDKTAEKISDDKRTVKLYRETLQSPTAGFSIGAPVTYTVEEITENN